MDNNFNYTGVNSRKFDDPFLLPSSQSFPDTLQTALDLCLFLYYLNPQYIQASARVARHFVTDFDYPGDGSTDEKSDLDEYLHYTLQLPSFMTELGDEWAAYGNGFARIHFPFDRMLVDPRTNSTYSLDFFGRKCKYNYQKMMYNVPDPGDPKGTSRVDMSFRDYPSTDISRVKLRKINPRYITIHHNPISGDSQYVYRFEPEVLSDVKKGRLHVVNTTPMQMLEAISKNEDFMFSPDSIFHLKAPTVCGISNAGWGMPGTIANYRNLHQLQVYRKIDEAVGMDYMLPFRIFSPAANMQPNEAFALMRSERWTSEIRKIIQNRRLDKFAMHSLPFPVEYQEFGYQGKELTPKDLIEFQTGALLDGMGYPQELFKGSLTWMQVPTAMRLFENSFMFLHMGFNSLTQWVVRRIQAWAKRPKIKIMLQKPSLADSLERKQLVFQLGAMGEISRETAYSALGIDNVVDEVEKRLEEDMEIEKRRLKLQTEFQREAETGSLEGADAAESGQQSGTAPGMVQPGGVPGQTPLDTQSDADSLAQYWLQIPSDGERAKAMSAVRNQNESLYSLAKEKMEQYRRQGESQGRESMSQPKQASDKELFVLEKRANQIVTKYANIKRAAKSYARMLIQVMDQDDLREAVRAMPADLLQAVNDELHNIKDATMRQISRRKRQPSPSNAVKGLPRGMRNQDNTIEGIFNGENLVDPGVVGGVTGTGDGAYIGGGGPVL